MQDLKYLEEFDSPSSIRLIVLKLPYKYRERWRSLASDIHERQNRAKCIDLVLFVEKQATIISNPLYGDIQDPVVARNALPKTTKDFKYIRARGSGSSFATTMKVVSEGTTDRKRLEINVSNGR